MDITSNDHTKVVHVPHKIKDYLGDLKRQGGGKFYLGDRTMLKVDKLAYFVYLVSKGTRTSFKRDDISCRLHSQLLRVIDKNYKRYLNALEDFGIIERDGSYHPGVSSKAVRFRPGVNGPVTAYVVTDRVTLNAIRRYEAGLPDHGYPLAEMSAHLPRVRVRYASALDRLNGLRDSGEIARAVLEKYPDLDPILNPNELEDHVRERYRTQMYKIENVDNRALDLTVGTNRRVYSDLTNMRREFRHDLFFEGFGDEGISLVDIKACQPFLLSILFFHFSPSDLVRHLLDDTLESLWSDHFSQSAPLTGRSGSTGYARSESRSKEQRKGRQTDREIDRAQRDKETKKHINVAGSLHKAPNTPTTLRFLDATHNLDFYDVLREDVLEGSGIDMDRETAKKKTYAILFDRPVRQNKFTKAFRRAFPEVHDYTLAVRQDEHNRLALILQRFEAWIMIRNVAYDVERLGVPYFTVHDCFAVPTSQKENVARVVYDSIKRLIGNPAQLSIDDY